ncbi:uncharacterized protein GGS22DRAFT_96735 [Annulohypoxylon maeteangense]|uniref:uncharacterized protein n=1 Tax=Annulohypoxylon maeteangense TaxID=1927788 RepID=UPI002008E622|nr:uncharacterized protein GGS22DRAFT_96735 [Annulohypoxylon maeteangense]KAI0888398.1 hypothetical protein GGS22DRAFT_96735 [Annulohypoxylon maeteangense]
MYSRDEISSAVLRLYQEVIRHPYMDENALILPPPNGWDTVSIEGKNETVMDLLRHLPYLRSVNSFRKLLIHWETIPICYSNPENYNFQEEIYPLPAHCVYLTRSHDREGTSLIIDTNEGTITEYSNSGTEIVLPYEEFEALPEAENWRGFRTTPAVELLDTWRRKYEKLVWTLVPNPIGRPQTGRFYSRADSRFEEEQFLNQERLEPWQLQDDVTPDQESEFDRIQREARTRAKKHAGDVYNTYLRYGWPDHFDKGRCRAELLEMEKNRDADERRHRDAYNPDAGRFD